MKKGEVPGVDFSSGEWYSVLKSVKRFHTLKRSAMALEVMSSNSSNERNWAMKIKQLFVGVAMVGLLGMVPSLARAEVSSAVIGMQEIEITTTWTLLGVSFFDMKDTSVETVSIQDFIAGDGLVNGDQLQVLNEDGQGGYTVAVWNEDLGFWSKSRLGRPSTTKIDLTLKKGDGVWLKKLNVSTDAPQKIVTFGRVQVSEDPISLSFPNNYHLVSLPIFDANVAINGEKVAWSGLTYGDQMQELRADGSYNVAVWNGTKWMVSRLGRPSTKESEMSITPFSALWVISSGADAKVTYTPPKKNETSTSAE